MVDMLKKIQELIDQNKKLEQRNEELKNILEINLVPKKPLTTLPIKELIGKTEIESLVFNFYKKYKVPAALFMKDDGVLFSIGGKRICSLHQQTFSSSGKCCSEIIRHIHQNDNISKYFHYKCLYGFNAITFPIFVRKKHIATLIFNQFFYQNEIPGIQNFQDIISQYNLTEDELLNFLSEIPAFSNSELDVIINQGIILAEMISFIGGKNLEFYEKFKFQISNEHFLFALKDKVSEQEGIIKTLMNCINEHFKNIKEGAVYRIPSIKDAEKQEIRLEQTEKLLNNILTTLPLGIIFIKKDIITYANDQIFRLTGYTPKEIIGRDPLFILPEYELWDKLNQLSPYEFLFKEFTTFKTTIRSKMLGIQNVTGSVAPINPDKPTEGYVMSFMDFSRMEQTPQEHNSIISSTDEHIPGLAQYDWSNKTILLAEDEELNYYYIQKILSPTKVKIKWAENGQKAIDFFDQDPHINLVLMDIRMPVINGIEATKIIKSRKEKIPVIAQTAYFHEINKEVITNAGCDEFISKPLKPELFLPLLDKFLS